jgi:hypothetical protein
MNGTKEELKGELMSSAFAIFAAAGRLPITQSDGG